MFFMRSSINGKSSAFQADDSGSIPGERTPGVSSNQARTKSLYGFYPGSNPGIPITP